MEFGYGATIGVKIGNSDRRVIHITGDGSFHMKLNEGCTAVSYQLPIITIILNNKVLGMVHQLQEFFCEGRFSQTAPERRTNSVKVPGGRSGLLDMPHIRSKVSLAISIGFIT